MRIGSGRPARCSHTPHPASAHRYHHARGHVSQRQVATHVASIFVTPSSEDSIDAVDLQPAQTCTDPFEYPPGYSLFRVKRTKKPLDVEPDAPIEEIREQEFLSSRKTGTHHISIYTSKLAESVDFYTKGLGFTVSSWRPNGLPYDGAWFNVPSAHVSRVGHDQKAMIHLIELPNPDDFGRCRDESCIVHFSIAIQPGTLKDFHARMDANGFTYYKSVNSRQAAVFCDPNGYRLEVIEVCQDRGSKSGASPSSKAKRSKAKK